MLTLFELGEDPRLLAFPLESAECVLERLIFFDVNERHPYIPPFFVAFISVGILTLV
jgi:hypothetical protein